MRTTAAAHGPQVRAHDHDGTVRRVAAPVGRFLLHYAEMCVVMCVGAVALSVLFFQGAASLGRTNLPEQAPVLSVAVIAVNLSVPMAAWMRFRGMDWRPTLEMAGATLAVGLLLIVGYLTGAVPQASLIEVQTSLACPVMLAVMIPRFRLYSSHGAHHRAGRVRHAPVAGA
ncbi:hypothetical protein ATJ97_1662 [Georgenia soli]|uniref:Uncharacterized protein n=1 Tax=Georgenia soli TaxID=638953 RepID=A0A2A9EJB1_9MICO|nr:hypothetical protein ATJ97_1662 [Georgenia soli]